MSDSWMWWRNICTADLTTPPMYPSAGTVPMNKDDQRYTNLYLHLTISPTNNEQLVVHSNKQINFMMKGCSRARQLSHAVCMAAKKKTTEAWMRK